MENKTEGKFILKALSQKEILAMYDISYPVFKRWIKSFEQEIGELKGNFYTVKQVQVIIHHLGIPGIVEF
jgi:transposase